MKLKALRLSNFQCFAEYPTAITFDDSTFLLGPNGSGKTAVLQALSRMFALDPGLRRVQQSDFHVDTDETTAADELWVEADFEFPELKDSKTKHSTVPSHFAHMRLEAKDGLPHVRYRLEATKDADGEIEELFYYVLQVDENDDPVRKTQAPKAERRSIQVHYVPAKRDPHDHISYSASSLLGRLLRAASWADQSEEIASLTQKITSVLGDSEAIVDFNKELTRSWTALHKGTYYAEPKISFERDDIESLLRHLTVAFTPGHENPVVDFSRLGDGQRSLLYVSLVIAVQELGRKVISKEIDAWDVERLRPPVFTIIAMEEPENSLSPQYLGRLVRALTDFANHLDAQSIVTTHSPALLRRVPPERIRYLRLDEDRETIVKPILLPPAEEEAYKFVREAVQAFPELYFSRLVVLGEGDSEEIALPRFFEVHGLGEDTSSIVVVPLGGRHANHFWRLLNGLEIPYVTLLDLDLGRYQGGWGRVRYAAQQLRAFSTDKPRVTPAEIAAIPAWNSGDKVLTSEAGKRWLKRLEDNSVCFSAPLDLDIKMLIQFAKAYGVEEDQLEPPDGDTISAVLGKKHHGEDQYPTEHKKLFKMYHSLFQLSSKPVQHLKALAELEGATLKANTPQRIARLIADVKQKLSQIPE
jgi:putative ATP-dependent endonuclease of OLD family